MPDHPGLSRTMADKAGPSRTEASRNGARRCGRARRVKRTMVRKGDFRPPTGAAGQKLERLGFSEPPGLTGQARAGPPPGKLQGIVYRATRKVLAIGGTDRAIAPGNRGDSARSGHLRFRATVRKNRRGLARRPRPPGGAGVPPAWRAEGPRRSRTPDPPMMAGSRFARCWPDAGPPGEVRGSVGLARSQAGRRAPTPPPPPRGRSGGGCIEPIRSGRRRRLPRTRRPC